MSYTPRILSRLGNGARPVHITMRAIVRQSRSNGTYQPPTPPPTKDNPHRNFWNSFGRPIAKVFLGAMVTYQLVYFTWLKLEAVEEKFDKDAEVKRLEAQLHGLTKDKDASKAQKK
ncbi:hypothetical protein BDZ85DRAFT_137209 [Elsinoe ampelina]|uniref:Inner membrane assembly complex subunit 17 n=1 Tax=Elsinoe ampelina TaxID=302913 RepID=A0A6A6G8V9_9PEZI|nr:hypothetical protein BDZ85DRAFT_137209 [Elsinoe ampelina]